MTRASSSLSSLSGVAIASKDHTEATTNTHVDRHFSRRGHGAEFEMEVRWILRNLSDDAAHVLDIGCGIGALFPRIGESRVVGIDYAHTGLCRTRDRFPKSRLACSDGAALPFADCSFDAITAQHVIEHFADARLACTEWRRVIRPRGRMIIVTPNAEYCDPSIFDDPSHVQLFDQCSLRRLMVSCGLQVEQICTLGLPWFHDYQRLPGIWRLRRALLQRAEMFARLPFIRWAGQSLCCVARRSDGE